MSEVQYKIVAGFPGYRVGTNGTVFSRLVRGGVGKRAGRGACWLIGKEWRELRPVMDRKGYKGYKVVNLYRVGEKVTAKVHRLVLEAFVGPCPQGQETRHLNGNPSDNNLDNLTWGTPSENTYDAIAHGTRVAPDTRGQKNGNAKLSEFQAREIRRRSRIGECQQALAGEFCVSSSTVSGIKLGRFWSCLDTPRLQS